MARHFFDSLARPQVPEIDGEVFTCTSKILAVGTNRQCRERSLMPDEYPHTRAALDVPQTSCPVTRSRGQI